MLPRLLLILRACGANRWTRLAIALCVGGALALAAGCATTPPANRYPPVELAPNQHPTPAAAR